jgi:hypothetical protein
MDVEGTGSDAFRTVIRRSLSFGCDVVKVKKMGKVHPIT